MRQSLTDVILIIKKRLQPVLHHPLLFNSRKPSRPLSWQHPTEHRCRLLSTTSTRLHPAGSTATKHWVHAKLWGYYYNCSTTNHHCWSLPRMQSWYFGGRFHMLGYPLRHSFLPPWHTLLFGTEEQEMFKLRSLLCLSRLGKWLIEIEADATRQWYQLGIDLCQYLSLFKCITLCALPIKLVWIYLLVWDKFHLGIICELIIIRALCIFLTLLVPIIFWRKKAVI